MRHRDPAWPRLDQDPSGPEGPPFIDPQEATRCDSRHGRVVGGKGHLARAPDLKPSAKPIGPEVELGVTFKVVVDHNHTGRHQESQERAEQTEQNRRWGFVRKLFLAGDKKRLFIDFPKILRFKSDYDKIVIKMDIEAGE